MFFPEQNKVSSTRNNIQWFHENVDLLYYFSGQNSAFRSQYIATSYLRAINVFMPAKKDITMPSKWVIIIGDQ